MNRVSAILEPAVIAIGLLIGQAHSLELHRASLMTRPPWPPTDPSPHRGALCPLYTLSRTWPKVHHGPLEFLSAGYPHGAVAFFQYLGKWRKLRKIQGPGIPIRTEKTPASKRTAGNRKSPGDGPARGLLCGASLTPIPRLTARRPGERHCQDRSNAFTRGGRGRLGLL